ncbi:MAG: hypothetical protein KGZ79_10340 [Dethiobacter sp.]|jgi:Na+-translocating ferredoxin:NAD+ oxidoreductase RNF subunit RnfB|nr:hypothetical protein [Dethiobacter sp.]
MVLPGANCGACGYPGCEGFALAVVNGAAPAEGCPVGGAEVAEKACSFDAIHVENNL